MHMNEEALQSNQTDKNWAGAGKEHQQKGAAEMTTNHNPHSSPPLSAKRGEVQTGRNQTEPGKKRKAGGKMGLVLVLFLSHSVIKWQ